ncbi:MAG: glycosyltransferase family 2 protein [Lachnospiraceae bacterium]|nr:glycosyltransferase family 2 protein [Lachnospiraceae bacterium]
MKKISVVVSVYNEELALEKFYEETVPILENCQWEYELIFVNDGSVDGSLELLREFAEGNNRVRVVNFSRNFGHEAAMIAGLDHSTGDGAVCLDADLQHPPAYIPEIISRLEEGYQVINMVRTKNDDAGLIKKITSGAFYKVLNWMSPVKFENNASDFFALDKRVVEVMKREYRERIRFLRGFIQNVGFRRTTIEYEAQKRVAGESKYSIRKLLKFSIHTLFSFSDMPLKLGVYCGCITALFGFILMVYTIINKICFDVPSGYSTIIVFLSFMFAVLMILIGVIGEYIAILFSEIKERPIYLVDEVIEHNDRKTE